MSDAEIESGKPTEVYDSAVDAWIVIMLLLGPLAPAAVGVVLLLSGKPGDASILFLASSATLVLTMALTMPCRYTLLKDAVSVRCGLVFFQIPFDRIRQVEPSATWRSGAALSMKRVLIHTDRSKYVVSPKQREQFIERLRAAAGLSPNAAEISEDTAGLSQDSG